MSLHQSILLYEILYQDLRKNYYSELKEKVKRIGGKFYGNLRFFFTRYHYNSYAIYAELAMFM